MPRIKSSSAVLPDTAAFEIALDKIASQQLELEKTIADHNAQKATQDKAHKTKIKRLNDDINTRFAQCESFSAHHRDLVLSGKQSSQTKLALFGYRKSPGILKTLNSKFTFTKALGLLKEAGKLTCIKVTETLDKQAVRRDIPESELPSYGLRLDAPEEFWVEPKKATQTPNQRLK